MSSGATIDQLRALLASRPQDVETRTAVVRFYLAAGKTSDAMKEFELFDEDSRSCPAVLALGIELYSKTHHHIKAARFRREARQAGMNSFSDPSRHPSRAHLSGASSVKVVERHLKVVRDEHGETGPAVAVTRPERRLRDVVGLATVKATLTRLVDESRHPGKDKGAWLGGTLLYGPPNCGKHFSAQVLAGELDAELWSVNLAAAAPVNTVLDQIRPALTRKSGPRVVFFLEHLDTVPGHVDQHAGALLSNLVPLLDGARQEGALIIGASTYPWLVSPLIVRPGRLGEVLLLLPPDAPARREFLSHRLADSPRAAEQELDWLVQHSEGYSFGDLDELLAIARRVAAENTELELRDISHAAIRKARQTQSPTSADWLTTAGHHALMNEQGGMYDDLLAYFQQREKMT